MKRIWFLCFALCPPAVWSEEIWLQPERVLVTPGATLGLRLSMSEGDEGKQIPLTADHVERALSRVSGDQPSLVNPMTRENGVAFSVRLPTPGVLVFAVELKGRVREIVESAVESHLRSLHAGEALRAEWHAMPQPRRWRENHVLIGKTFVRVGEPAADDRSWAEPLGLPLEIVPENDPTSLRVGAEFTVRLTQWGKPQLGAVLTFRAQSEGHERVVVTNEEGRATARLDTSGMWSVHALELRRAASADRPWESESTTIFVTVK